MADRPILFSGPMVRALLAGTKTQTRRALNPQPPSTRSRLVGLYAPGLTAVFEDPQVGSESDYKVRIRCMPGDRLYVREHWRTWARADDTAPRDLPRVAPVEYVASPTGANYGRFRQGMHMPRWASRITLTVTDVRVERLQDCSAADAVAEGALSTADVDQFAEVHAIPMYRAIWTGINGPGSWDANPWVAAYTFTVEHGNIDQLRAAS